MGITSVIMFFFQATALTESVCTTGQSHRTTRIMQGSEIDMVKIDPDPICLGCLPILRSRWGDIGQVLSSCVYEARHRRAQRE